MCAPAQESVKAACVVVPCRNEARSIPALLEALRGQSKSIASIVVVDDASTDDTATVARTWALSHSTPRVVVVASDGRGAAAAMNTGVRKACSDIIVRLDGHCQPDAHYIDRSLETLETHGAGVVGGRWDIQPGAETWVARAIAAVLCHPLGSGGADYRRPADATRQEIRAVDTVPFGAFRKSVWAEIGGFDESLVRNQDYDFNYRVRLTGRKVLLNPAIISIYRPRATFAALAAQYFAYGFWKIVMLKKFPRSLRIRQLLPILLMPAIVVLAASALFVRQPAPWWLLGAYLALVTGGAMDASWRARDPWLTPPAFVALLLLQAAWSSGAWAALLTGGRARRAAPTAAQ